MVKYLEDFSRGYPISAEEPAQQTWLDAFASFGGNGGKLHLGDGRFEAPQVRIPDGLSLEGNGHGTEIVHPWRSNEPSLNAFGSSYVEIAGLTVDGGRQYVRYADKPFLNAEIVVDGINNRVHHVTVRNFNAYGIAVAGPDASITDNHVIGARLGMPYGSNHGPDLGSIYGILTVASRFCTRPTISRNHVSGTRSAGIVAGGSFLDISGNQLDSCHMGTLPDGTYPGEVATGGGQLAIGLTVASNDDPTPIGSFAVAIKGNLIGGSSGPSVHGIEINRCYDVVCGQNIVTGQTAHGISLVQVSNASLAGNVASGCSLAGVRVAEGSAGVVMSGLAARGNKWGVYIESGIAMPVIVSNSTFLYQQECNLLNLSATAHIVMRGNIWDSLDSMADRN